MNAAKAIKVITITAQATESHHLIKVNNIIKWLKSGHNVKVNITGRPDRQKQMESIFDKIQKDTKTGSKILQKMVKPESIKFTIQPNEDASKLVTEENLKDSNKKVDDNLDVFIEDKDIFSEEFEKELEQSIREEMSKKSKKR